MVDLDAIDAVVGDARVVGLGESVHAAHECYVVKDVVFRHLVEHRGFRVFALESGFAEGLLVDAWVTGDDRCSLDDVLRRGFTYNMGCCEEFAAQLVWMREWNDIHPDDPVHYVGTDVPGWVETPKPALDVARALLARVDPDATVDDAELAWWLANREPEYARRSSPLEAASATRAAETAVDLTHMDPTQTTGTWSRDMTMAHTILWALRVHGAKTRVVFGAHNGHLQRTPPWGGERNLTAGAYLAHHLGSDYVAVGTTYGSAMGFGELEEVEAFVGFRADGYGDAQAGTVDQAMAVGARGVVDLRRESVPGDRMRIQGYSIAIDVAAAFDALVHLEALTYFTPRSVDRPDA